MLDIDPTAPSPIRIIENIWIPLSDGSRLAAKVWLPEGAADAPVPAVLEYIPYRKRDHKAIRDAEIHGFFARHGYAGVRVDLRGSGDSDGILRDEYLQQELDDGLEVLRWIAAQTWCTGKVGLFGLSWGGFNALQLAALQPPEVGAIITVCSSDDRYADDVHYMGGCLLTDNLSWASTMFAFNSCPPDPQIVGEARWREMWLDRLEGSGLWLKTWLTHQRRDDYWKHASVAEDHSRIRVPVMAVSGWADGYTNTVFRLMANLDAGVPRRGLIGAWGHKYPHMGGPGPVIDFLGECVRWWDQWLKGIDRGVDDEPAVRAWMLDTSEPTSPRSPGRWIAEQVWPSPRIAWTSFYPAPGLLSPDPDPALDDASHLTVQSPLSVGMFAGKWCSYAEATDLPWDQRQEDGGSLVFDTLPLDEDVEILGAPEVTLDLSVDKPVAMLAVRLCDVAPNDRATRVTFGVLNLTHRDSHETPEPLEPGRRYRVTVRLNNIAQRFRAGNRIRLALSTSYFPLAWPSPEPYRLTVYPAGCRLDLPVRPPRAEDARLRHLGQPRTGPAPHTKLLAPAQREWVVNQNLAQNVVELNIVNNDPFFRLYNGQDDADETGWDDLGAIDLARNTTEKYSYTYNFYDTLRGEVTTERRFRRGGWEVMTVTRTILTSTRSHFLIRATLDAYEGDVRIFSKSWDERIARDLV
ncbi:peptidase S15 [Rhodothalassium salexigens]|uniref:CocE/NonD family hydrolase n=1 Tax=Rhodothalassium salexigens TaxID=1086 RepID=UPI001913EAC4|nr:CocE/NonD family hydrolase [Rhodothalassium salexigens]MBK5911341.1 peptidase S15 [Rhodothalassium salexigens]